MTATVTGGGTASIATTAASRDASAWFTVNQQAQALDAVYAGAFTGLAAGTGVLALAMAAGCAWGLSRRLAEYR